MKVIVTGSLGNVAKPLAQTLIQQGHDVTVVSSSAAKQADIEAVGASAAIGNVQDAAFLETTFRDADAVFAMIPPNHITTDLRAYYREVAGNYAQAARNAGVKHLVHLSSYGAHLDHGTGIILGAHDAEGILNNLDGITVTHLRPGYFATNLFPYVGMIKGAGFMASNHGDSDRILLVHPRDIAAAAASAINNSSAGHNILYVVSEEHTCQEIAQALGAAIGKPDLTWKTFPDAQVLQSLLGAGLPQHFAVNLVELGAAIHSGLLQGDVDQHKPFVGKTTLADVAEEFVEVYNR